MFRKENKNQRLILERCNILEHACQIFKGKIEGVPAFGWRKKSIGHKFVGIKNKVNWLSISNFESYISAQHYTERIGKADKLKGIHKPSLKKGLYLGARRTMYCGFINVLYCGIYMFKNAKLRK